MAITLTSDIPAQAYVGKDFRYRITATGGTAPYNYSITGEPSGVTGVAASGAVLGTPDTIDTYTISCTVTDSVGASASGSYPCEIICNTISLHGIPNGHVNVAYSQGTAAKGGIAPYSYAITDPADPAPDPDTRLPDGLSLDTGTGVISGTPTTAESKTFTITATDDYDCTGALEYTLIITVNPKNKAEIDCTGA